VVYELQVGQGIVYTVVDVRVDVVGVQTEVVGQTVVVVVM